MQGVPPIFSKLAQQAAAYYVRYNETMPMPFPIPQDFCRQRACYVSILENPGHRLRSMYGQVLPAQDCLAQEIIINTIRALTYSSHRPVRRADLRQLHYSVAVLGPLQRVNSLYHLNPQTFGLYVKSDRGKYAILLPQRAGIVTAEEQLATAWRESGIVPSNEAVTMYRFSVDYDDN